MTSLHPRETLSSVSRLVRDTLGVIGVDCALPRSECGEGDGGEGVVGPASAQTRVRVVTNYSRKGLEMRC